MCFVMPGNVVKVLLQCLHVKLRAGTVFITSLGTELGWVVNCIHLHSSINLCSAFTCFVMPEYVVKNHLQCLHVNLRAVTVFTSGLVTELGLSVNCIAFEVSSLLSLFLDGLSSFTKEMFPADFGKIPSLLIFN